MENHYIGTELELFQQATNWKQYWMQAISPYIGVNLLEVGAGIGANTGILLSKFDFIETIKCVEPDPLLSTQIQNNISENLRPKCSVHTGFSSEIEPTELFDTILYIDVIEHIENDRLELENVKNLLKPNGHLIVLVPAYQYLFSEFDKAIGHYRRYNKSMLRFSAQTELVEKRTIPCGSHYIRDTASSTYAEYAPIVRRFTASAAAFSFCFLDSGGVYSGSVL